VRPADKSAGATGEKTDESNCCALGKCLTGSHNLLVAIHRAQLVIVDERNKRRFEIQQVEGEATLEGKDVGSVTLHGLLDGGMVQIARRLDRTLKEPCFDLQLEAVGVPLTEGMGGLRYLVPVLAGEHSQVEGKLNGRVSLHGRGTDLDMVGRSLR